MTRKSKKSQARRSVKKRTRTQAKKSKFNGGKALLLVLAISLTGMIGFPRYQDYQRNRKEVLQYAYFYCAQKIMQANQDKETIRQYYEAAQRIERKLGSSDGIEPTKKKMEKAYWAIQ